MTLLIMALLPSRLREMPLNGGRDRPVSGVVRSSPSQWEGWLHICLSLVIVASILIAPVVFAVEPVPTVSDGPADAAGRFLGVLPQSGRLGRPTPQLESADHLFEWLERQRETGRGQLPPGFQEQPLSLPVEAQKLA